MRLYVLLLALLFSASVFGQEDKKKPVRFTSLSGEINFSSARIISESGQEGGAVVRFAPWFNLQGYNNTDFENHGYFFGLTLRNIGFIYQEGNEKWKCRNYVLGIPLGLKFGDMDRGTFIYAGYEFEVPFNYRERYYRNDSRERVFNVWFSDRVNPYTHAGFVGFNFKGGFNLKFKYYFTEFFNPNFNNSQIDDPRDIRYAGTGQPGDSDYQPARDYLRVNVFYLSVTWNMFRRPRYYNYKYERIDKPDTKSAIY